MCTCVLTFSTFFNPFRPRVLESGSKAVAGSSRKPGGSLKAMNLLKFRHVSQVDVENHGVGAEQEPSTTACFPRAFPQEFQVEPAEFQAATLQPSPKAICQVRVARSIVFFLFSRRASDTIAVSIFCIHICHLYPYAWMFTSLPSTSMHIWKSGHPQSIFTHAMLK